MEIREKIIQGETLFFFVASCGCRTCAKSMEEAKLRINQDCFKCAKEKFIDEIYEKFELNGNLAKLERKKITLRMDSRDCRREMIYRIFMKERTISDDVKKYLKTIDDPWFFKKYEFKDFKLLLSNMKYCFDTKNAKNSGSSNKKNERDQWHF